MLHFVPQRTAHSIAAVFAAAMVFLSAPIFAADPPKVQVIDGTSGGGPQQQAINKNLLDRIQRLETSANNQSMVDTISRIDNLVQEMQTLLGRVEVLGHDIEQLKTTQRDQYLDIDTRLRRLETGGAGAAGGSAAATSASAAEIDELRKRQRELYLDVDNRLRRLERSGNSAAPASPSSSLPGAAPFEPVAPSSGGAPPAAETATSSADFTPVAPAGSVNPPTAAEKDAYERAFTQLKNGQYDQAIVSFKQFVQTYPNSELAGNAQYWLGEANYVQRQYPAALEEFNKVLSNYPDSTKRADAMLKLGFTYQELGERERAVAVLNDLNAKYPNTTAARLAAKRVQDLQAR